MTKYRDLKSEDLTKDEVDTFVKLVSTGGAVNENFVRQGVKRPGARVVFAEIDGRTVGVAALKIPLDEYRSGLQTTAKANCLIPQKDYPYELGYVSVLPDHGGGGIARRMIQIVLGFADGKGIFATTGHPAMKDGLLPSFDFLLVGNTWKNEAGDSLNLLLRTSQDK
jgi:GNAT superfamily N-acetyltransferase